MPDVHHLHLLHDHGQVADVKVQPGTEQAVTLPQQVRGALDQAEGFVQVVELLGVGVEAQGAGEPHIIQVAQHAVDVAVGGVDVGKDGADLNLVGRHATFQGLEALGGAVLRVPVVVAQVIHVLLVVVQEGGDVVQLQLQPHHLQHQVVHALRILADLPSCRGNAALDALHQLAGLGGGGPQPAEEAGVVLPLGDDLLQRQRLLVRLPLDDLDPVGGLSQGEVHLLHGCSDVVALLGQALERVVQLGGDNLPAPNLGQELPQAFVDLPDGEGAVVHLAGDLVAGG